MATTKEQLQSDIQAAKEEKSVELEMIDGKISASFCIEKNMQNQWSDQSQLEASQQYSMTEYEKIFDNWKAFNDYADVFFKN